MRNTLIVIGLVVVLALASSWFSRARSARDPDIIATRGLHWHAHLSLEVGTTTVAIPAGIGLVGQEMALHTHDASGVIHMEFAGTVRKEDLELGKFFAVWGRPLDSFGANPRMTVNGATSTALGAYQMKDGDTIVLTYDDTSR